MIFYIEKHEKHEWICIKLPKLHWSLGPPTRHIFFTSKNTKNTKIFAGFSGFRMVFALKII